MRLGLPRLLSCGAGFDWHVLPYQAVRAHFHDVIGYYGPELPSDLIQVPWIGEVAYERLVPKRQYFGTRQISGSQWKRLIPVLGIALPRVGKRYVLLYRHFIKFRAGKRHG